MASLRRPIHRLGRLDFVVCLGPYHEAAVGSWPIVVMGCWVESASA